ncbi:MAG: permease [Candidatus ainarchaeum sp.]|nr:permease [Candidatus ainarchaeum sp.]
MKDKDKIIFIAIILIFLIFYFLPYNFEETENPLLSGINLLSEYSKQHILTCLVPALFIAGAIVVFIQKEKILKYLGYEADKKTAYAIASFTGIVLAVCSCTILPLFAGIRKRGAGLGPAITFLFAGPAINIAAIFLTFSVLGYEIGIARVIASLILSIAVGVTMAFVFKEKINPGELTKEEHKKEIASSKILLLFFGSMIGILIVNGLQIDIYTKYILIALFTIMVIAITIIKLKDGIAQKWLRQTWRFSKTILPMLFIGVFIMGFISPLIPEEMVVDIVGENSIQGNLISSVFGVFMYFSTLTEIVILEMLISKGMASGPALALLLAGPSLSLPNMLVIKNILGTKKTAVYVLCVIVYSCIAGLIFGFVYP